ncbi:MAG: LysM peptidoglycan-binding domain-containing protein [Chloroflexota bacterium]
MTDRLPIVDGAPACPFVAFEDDRDARATAPDHRHRCFAESRPAPRALAHQEAYCLSSAFPVCPTFQDWARREAAAARPAPASEAAASEEPPVSRPLPPREREPRHAPGTDTPPPIPPRRHQPRDWAAPPPWSADDAADAAGTDAAGAAGAAAGALWGPGTAAAGAGGAGMAAPDDVAPPSFLAPRSSSRDDEWAAASRGLAGSAADRLAGPSDDEPLPRATRAPAPPPDEDADDDRWSGRPARDEWPAPPQRAATGAVPADRRGSGRRQAGPPPRRDQGRHPRVEDAQELFGPAWERPRRYEAYPTLRTRVGLPSFSSLWIAVAALVLAGAFLFFVGPMLLGLGGDSPGTGGGATPSPTPETASPSPTLPPEPTAQVYVVAKGDTMSKIAKRFDVTIEQLLAANPQIKNPDRIKIGDQLTIPVPVSDDVSGGAGASLEP